MKREVFNQQAYTQADNRLHTETFPHNIVRLSLSQLANTSEQGIVEIHSRVYTSSNQPTEQSEEYSPYQRNAIVVIPGCLLKTLDPLCQTLADTYQAPVITLYSQTRGTPDKRLDYEAAGMYRYIASLGITNTIIVGNSEGGAKALFLTELIKAQKPTEVVSNLLPFTKPGIQVDGLLLLSPVGLDTQEKLGKKFLYDALGAGVGVWTQHGYTMQDRHRAFKLGANIGMTFTHEMWKAHPHIKRRVATTITNMSLQHTLPPFLPVLDVPTCIIGHPDDPVALWNERYAQQLFKNVTIHPFDKGVGHGTVLILDPTSTVDTAYNHLRFNKRTSEEIQDLGIETDREEIAKHARRFASRAT